MKKKATSSPYVCIYRRRRIRRVFFSYTYCRRTAAEEKVEELWAKRVWEIAGRG